MDKISLQQTSRTGKCGVSVLVGIVWLFALNLTASADEDRWQSLKQTIFGDVPIQESSDVIALEAPNRAHDAAIVPIVIKALDPGRRIEQVHVIVDKNPLPLAGVFRFTEEAGSWRAFETRIRINEYTDVRAVAQLQDGSLHMTSKFVKAAGGCSAPALSDMEAAMANAGKMKLMLEEINDNEALMSEAVVKISHPNNSGMQFDQISRNYIPAFFIHTIGVDINDKKLMEVDTNFSLSENPVVRLQLDPDTLKSPSTMSVYAVDSEGNNYTKSVELEIDGS